MTSSPGTLAYRDPFGVPCEAKIDELAGPEPPAGPPLEAARVRIACGDLDRADVTARRIRPVPLGNGRTEGYEQLDNEILAGVRVARLYRGRPHPAEVTRLIGYDADSAEPFALLEPLRGEPVGGFAGRMLSRDRKPFQRSLLRAILVINGAGIVHRGISPETVLWDSASQTVQLTDFTRATLVGAPRTVVGAPPWQAPEQRPQQAVGRVSDRDDLWAAAKLIYYVITGQELHDLRALHDNPELGPLLGDVINAPDRRPSTRELLQRLGSAPMVPSRTADSAFEQGRRAFHAQRARKRAGEEGVIAEPAGRASDEQQPEAQAPSDGPAAEAAAPRPALVAVALLLMLIGLLAVLGLPVYLVLGG